MELRVEDFIRLRNYIHERAGIFLETKKIYFLKKRLEKRMAILGLDSPQKYLRYLKFKDLDGKEFQALIELITVNETYFFRGFDQLVAFAEHCLPEVCEIKRENGDNKLKIWSAGCSTGEEAYTLAIILMEMLEDFYSWDIEILASDIDTKALERAKLGIYPKRSVKNVPLEYLQKYFSEIDGTFKINPMLKRIVKFKHINLVDEKTMRRIQNMDFIFCRNVLIYFDDKARREVVSYFYDSLNPSGFIFLGHSESLQNISTAFDLKRKGNHIVYQKPERRNAKEDFGCGQFRDS